MSGYAWLLHGFWVPGLQIGCTFKEWENNDDEFMARYVRNRSNGFPLGPDEVPKSMDLMIDERPAKLRRCPPTFNGPGMMVREDVAAVLRQFRLGQSALYPMPLTMGPPDRQPAPCPPYFLLCIGERRERLLPEMSTGLRPPSYDNGKWSSDRVETNDAIALRASPPLDVDLWHDPQDYMGNYCSDELYRGLKAAGFGRAFRPVRCRLVAPN